MKIVTVKAGETSVAVVSGDEIIITDVQSALDLMATVRYETDCDRFIMDKALISEAFFDLSTRIAGEIMQKFVNYQMKAAIVGDFSAYSSQSLKDFIYETNKGSHIFFLSTEQSAIEKFSKLS